MNLVTAVLVCFIIASVPVFLVGVMLISGERSELKKMTELAQSGVEVEARLMSLVPFGTRGYASAAYEFQTPDGRAARHQTGVNFGSAHVVGDAYPLVHHPTNTKVVHMGTLSTVRKEVRFRKSSVRGAQRTALLSLAAGVLATIGLIVSPS
ncbi:hypothetical protein [Streptomyces erythrochromogenes]|uniref:hypothetical protein n=1 Tax=Streptomyces erythrochromogenes TaxID=285574 RepID=UPI00386C9563|nr:hypothetical protein OG489_01250 [Streptomyces erythrochromogenes]